MNLSLIQTNDYNTTHLSTSCYKNGFDLLRAYNYIDTNLSLTISDIEALLPPLLYTVENPGCQRQPPPRQRGTFLDVCLFGVILLVFTKCVHLLSIHIVKNKYSRGFANNKSSITDNSDVDFSSAQCSQWFCLGFIAFICGLMLGSIIYHFIPQIYEIPNESFDYMYLGRATLIFCGIYLFFIVEKLLHLRLKVDETSSNETLNDTSELAKLSTEDMSQIAKMHKTLNVEREDNTQHMHLSDAPAIPVHFHSHDDDADLQSNICSLTTNNTIHHHHHHPTNNIKTGTCNLIFYHVIGDSLNDFIYGCSLSTALAQHHLIGLVVWFVILMDGFRRHLQTTSLIGRKYSTYLLLVSLVVLLFGFIVGGLLGDVSKPTEQHQTVVRGEYIYSITYGTFFYSALVTLIPKLHELGQHLQIVTKPSSQILGQQRHMKIYVLMCQNLFLLLGVLVPFIIAVVWRRFHRLQVYNFICTSDSSNSLCIETDSY